MLSITNFIDNSIRDERILNTNSATIIQQFQQVDFHYQLCGDDSLSLSVPIAGN